MELHSACQTKTDSAMVGHLAGMKALNWASQTPKASLTAHCLAASTARHWDARSAEMRDHGTAQTMQMASARGSWTGPKMAGLTDGCSASTMAEKRVPMKRMASTTAHLKAPTKAGQLEIYFDLVVEMAHCWAFQRVLKFGLVRLMDDYFLCQTGLLMLLV